MDGIDLAGSITDVEHEVREALQNKDLCTGTYRKVKRRA